MRETAWAVRKSSWRLAARFTAGAQGYPWAAGAADRCADAAWREEARETPRAGVPSGERGRVNGQPSAGPRNDVRGSPFGLGLGK
eukprot:1748297-Prymnesium_polylepis.1